MNTKYSSLIAFENDRKTEQYIPPEGSNSFYTIRTTNESGTLNLLTLRANPEDYRFDVSIHGHIYVGPGVFELAGDVVDINRPYGDMLVDKESTLSVNHVLSMNGGRARVDGELDMMDNSQLIIINGSFITLPFNSVLRLGRNVNIRVEDGASLNIYGNIILDMEDVDKLYDTPGVFIDSAATLTVLNLDTLGDRVYSFTDYERYMREKIVNKNTQGEFNFPEGRLGYTWVGGSSIDKSKVLNLKLLYGFTVLGDFKFSVLGMPINVIQDSQVINKLEIADGTRFIIAEKYEESTYMHPQLYIGPMIDNNKSPGECVINGTMEVSGSNASITVDRGGTITIGSTGTIILSDDATLVSTNNEDMVVMHVDGTLIIDSIEQIASLAPDNIELGPDAKIIIKNPSTDESRVLLTTPIGIQDSDLCRIFGDRLDRVEYHVTENCGIGIDKYFNHYSVEMVDWYGGVRLEKAIHDGMIVWHDRAFIELRHDVIPWINIKSTLLNVAELFKSYGSDASGKLQDLADRLRYAGSGDMRFRFVQGDQQTEVLLTLKGVVTTGLMNYPLTDSYHVTTTGDCELYLRSNIGSIDSDKIISDKSKVVEVQDTAVDFILK